MGNHKKPTTRPVPRPTTRPTTKKTVKKRAVFIDRAEENAKRSKEVVKNSRKLRTRLLSMIKSTSKSLLRRTFLKRTATLRVNNIRVSQYMNDIHNAISAFVKKYTAELIQKEVPRLSKLPYPKARKELLEKFKAFRKAYQTYLMTLSSLLAMNKNVLDKKKGQIDIKTFAANLKRVLKLIELPKGFMDLVEINNIAEYSASGKINNPVFNVFRAFNKTGALSPRAITLLGKKYRAFIYDRLGQGKVAKYEKFTLPMLLMNLSPIQKMKVIKETLKNAIDVNEAVFMLSYFLRADQITGSQGLALADEIGKKHGNTQAKLMQLRKKIVDGGLRVSRKKVRSHIQRLAMLMPYPKKKENFATASFNVKTFLLYNFVFYGAALGSMLGFVQALFYSVKEKDASYLVGMLTNKYFLLNAGIAAASLEAITGPRFGEGAVSKLLHYLGKKSLAKKIKAKAQERMLGRYLTNSPRLGYLFVQNYPKINQAFLQAGGFTKKLDKKKLDKALPIAKLEKIFGFKLPPTIDGVARNQIVIDLYMAWRVARIDMKIKTKAGIKAVYEKTLRHEGIQSKFHHARIKSLLKQKKKDVTTAQKVIQRAQQKVKKASPKKKP